MHIPLLSDATMLSGVSFQQALAIGNHQNFLVSQGRALATASYQDFAAFTQQLLAGEGPFAVLWEEIASFALSLARDGFVGVSKSQLREHVLAVVLTRSTDMACWQDNPFYPVCQTADLSKPGDYVTAEIFGDSVIAVLDEGQQIKVFYNICPHRYNRLLTGKGNVAGQKIQCSYHGWRFDLDGACSFVPLVKTFGATFCQADHGLDQLDVLVEQGCVYARPAGHSSAYAAIDHCRHSKATDIAARRELILRDPIGLWQPPQPEPVRLLIRLGYLESELGRIGANIAGQKKVGLDALLGCPLDSREQPKFCALRSEQRQLLLAFNEVRPEWSLAASHARILAHGHDAVLLPVDTPKPPFSGSPASDRQKIQQPRETWEALPLWVYDDPELYALEMDYMIKPVWQFVGHESEIPHPGDQCRLHIVGELIIVSRQASGDLLAERVIDANHAGAAQGETIGLDNWQGFIFVRISPDNGPSMQAFWDRKEGLFSPYFQNLVPIKGGSWYDIAIPANYKVVWENYLEVYHFPLVHKGRHRLCRPNFDSPFWPLRRHLSRHATEEESEYHACIFANGEHSMEDEDRLIAQAEKTRQLDKRLNYSMFGASPNQHVGPVLFGFTCFPEHVNVNSIIPTGPEECYLRSRCYRFPLDENSQRGKDLLRAQQINTESLLQCITEEDIVLNLRCQSVVGSRQFGRTGVLSREEDAIMHFQNHLRKTLPVTRLRQRPARGTVAATNNLLLPG